MPTANILKIALSKGRIFKESLPLLAQAGIVPIDDPTTSRKLIIDTNQADIKLVIIRATDVPVYVDYGAADIGIAGKDVLLEYGGDSLYEPLDLNIARCKLVVAGLVDAPPIQGRLRIATKFVNIARRFYAEKGIPVEIIKLYGSMELGPIVGLSDYIVDVMDTGNTLRANGLTWLEDIDDQISSRLIVNKASMKTQYPRIKKLIEQIESALWIRPC